MVTATGALASAATSALQGTGGSGGLNAQLARYEKQLAECINCASAKTPEGKQAIDELYGKIHDIKAKLEEVRNSSTVQSAAASPRVEQTGNAVAAPQDAPAAQGQALRRATVYDTVGSVIDFYG
jgi:hypothetical protein